MADNIKETAVYVAYEDHVPLDPANPERNLLRAMLMNAMSDLRKPGEVGRRAQEYFLNRDEEYIFSFAQVCAQLEIDPNQILIVTGLRKPRFSRSKVPASSEQPVLKNESEDNV